MKNLTSGIELLRRLGEVIAIFLCLILIVASGVLAYEAVLSLMAGFYQKSIVDVLFVIIVLELFYVVRSFLNRGSMNVGLIVNIGIIAAVKELIFKIDSLSLQMAISFGVIFISLGVVYLLEMMHYEKKRTDTDK